MMRRRCPLPAASGGGAGHPPKSSEAQPNRL